MHQSIRLRQVQRRRDREREKYGKTVISNSTSLPSRPPPSTKIPLNRHAKSRSPTRRRRRIITARSLRPIAIGARSFQVTGSSGTGGCCVGKKTFKSAIIPQEQGWEKAEATQDTPTLSSKIQQLTSDTIRLGEPAFVRHAALRDRVEEVCAGFGLGL